MSGLATLFAAWQSMREKRRQERVEEERRRLFREEAYKALKPGDIFDLMRLNVGEDVPSSLPRWPEGDIPSKEEIEEEVQSEVTVLQERLERIEQRFPEESTVEKISSINDAILATRVEQLQRSLDNLESRLITKWDVVTVVFVVLGAVGVVAGAIFTIANFVLK